MESTENGTINIEELEYHLNANVKILAMTHTSNVFGTVNPVKEIIEKALIDLNLVKIDEAETLLKAAEEKEKQSNQIIEFTKEIKKNNRRFS